MTSGARPDRLVRCRKPRPWRVALRTRCGAHRVV